MSKPIRVGIYGAGNFANKQHLPNLARIDDVEIVCVCDINEKAARDTASRFDIPRVYTNAHEMLNTEEMDAMWSIVPAFARTDVEATAASKGIHLFSEKPQALEMSVARNIDEAVRDAGVLSTVCFRERYRPIFQEAKRLLEDKEIVHIRFQSIRPLPEPRDDASWHSDFEKGASAFFDWGPHAVDYTRFITGLNVETAQAYLKHNPDRHRAPTSASFNFLMSNGATMSMTFVSASPTQPPDEPYFIVYYEGGYLGIHRYDHIDMNGETVFQAEEFNPWFELDRIFCEAVRSGDGKALLNDYHDGLYSLAPILAGWESARRGGEPIDIETFRRSRC
jgi:predicted dehydrogenase